MSRVVVIGGGGHAKVVVAVLKKLGFVVAGYTDPRDRGPLLRAAFLGNDEVLEDLIRKDPSCLAVLGTGKLDTSPSRMDLQRAVRSLGYRFPTIRSPQAIVNEEVELGPGTVVFDGAVVNSGTTVGGWSILNTSSTVEHDCVIGENVHVAPGATVSGGVRVGDNCMIGAGATLIHGITVGADCLVGAGSTVVDDLPGPGAYVG